MDAQVAPVLAVAPSYAGLLLVFFILATPVFVATKLCGRALAILLGFGLSVFCLMFLSYAAVRSVPAVQVEAAIDQREQAVAAEAVEPRSPDDASTEMLWNELMKSRIVLDEPRASEERPGTEVAESQEKRPAWLDEKPKRVGNVYRRVISSDPFKTEEECHDQLDEKLRLAVQERMHKVSSVPYTGSLDALGIGLDYVFREICREEYVETSMHDFGEMKTVHVLLEFTAATDKHLVTASKNRLRQDRIEKLAAMSFSVLAALAGIYGLLKFDTLTRGYYTKRLVLGILGGGLILVLLNVS